VCQNERPRVWNPNTPETSNQPHFTPYTPTPTPTRSLAHSPTHSLVRSLALSLSLSLALSLSRSLTLSLSLSCPLALFPLFKRTVAGCQRVVGVSHAGCQSQQWRWLCFWPQAGCLYSVAKAWPQHRGRERDGAWER